MGRLLALIGALIAAALIAWGGARTPEPQPASAPATAFSAERAMADVRVIGREPHAVGTDANRRVRDYLMGRMTALGLSPQVRAGVGVRRPKSAANVLLAGRVENIVGVLPGRDRAAPALALMAHYDSVPASPGAADDAAGVATALEVVRAIKARGTPARDVMLAITDGEEAGLLGANAFFRRDPLAERIGFVLNMEARGSGGRVLMFETAAGNGEAIDLLRRTNRRGQASSLAGYVYQNMPNDSDFTEVKRAGVGGLNYAFAGNQFDYHSPTSTPATLDRGSLQDMGDQVLPTALAAATATDLPRPAPDLVYNEVFGDLMLAYPPVVGWLVLAAAALLIGVGVRRARRIEPFPWIDMARGAGAALFVVLGVCAVLHFARRATGAAYGYLEQRFLLAQVERWEAAVLLMGLGFLVWAVAEFARGRRNVAFVPLAAGIACSAFGGFDKLGLGMGVAAAIVGLIAYGKPVTRPGAWAGVLVFGLVAAAAAQAYAPTAAAVLAWPVAFASIGAAATAMAARRGYSSLALLGLLAAIGLGWIGGLAHTAFLMLDLVELLAAAALLGAMLVWPLAQPEEGAPPARLIGPALVALGFGVMLAVRIVHPYDARHPQVSYVGYQVDQDSGHAWRFSRASDRIPWVDRALTADGGAIQPLKHWAFGDTMVAAPGPFVQQAAPPITLAEAADGSLRLHAAPPPGAPRITLQLKPNTAAVLVEAAGVPTEVALQAGKVTRVRWEAGPQGIDLVIRPVGPGALEVRYAALIDGWPAAARPLAPRPPSAMPFDVSDSTLVTGTRRFAW